MIGKYKFIVFLGSFMLFTQTLFGQTFCMTYVLTGNGTAIDIAVGLTANGSTFKLGAGNLQFKYNTLALMNPTLLSNTLAATASYSGITVTEPMPPTLKGTDDGLASINFYFTGSKGSGLPITLSNTPIAVVRFQIKNSGLSPNIRPYDNGKMGTIVYNDDPNDPILLSMGVGCPVYNTVLPIEWLSIKAYQTPNSEQPSATIDWATASERNNSHFVIERSLDGQLFEAIGQVKGKNQAAEYSFIDTKPFSSLNYYRIRQVDLDGQESISKVTSVLFKNASTLSIYPTLFTTTHAFLNIEWGINKKKALGATPSTFQIFNLLGQEVQIGQLTTRIDVSDLPQGAYIFKVGLEQAKFVKQ